jgi:hypothetical protein
MATLVTEKISEPKPSGGDYPELYKMLHAERIAMGEETRKLEKAAVTAVAALYAWLATHHIHGAMWYIAVPLVIIGAFRAAVMGLRMLFIKDYLILVEQRHFPSNLELPGYENYFLEGTKSKSRWYLHLRFTMLAIWCTLLGVTLIAPLLLDK